VNRRSTLLVLAAVLVTTLPASTSAADTSNEGLFQQGSTALSRGAYDEAIDDFELLADRGASHPDISFDRAMAYIGRASTAHQKDGDLGRAAAALEEVLLLRPGDDDAPGILERVREEIARRRARRGGTPVALHASLGWAVVGLASEDTWAVLAALGSLLTTVGLALRSWLRRREARIAGLVTVSVGLATLVTFGLLASLSRYQRSEWEPAVVVVADARLLEENGSPVTGTDATVPEGAFLRIDQRRGQLARVRWNDRDGWIALSQLRFLQRP
jgi:tetratricopeptide (TPR) repeat protein